MLGRVSRGVRREEREKRVKGVWGLEYVSPAHKGRTVAGTALYLFQSTFAFVGFCDFFFFKAYL